MRKIVMAVIAVLLLAWCQGAFGAVRVFVSIPPQQWLVKAIGGELVSVETLVRSGQDPHTFEPLPKQVAALSRADIWYVLDMEFEAQLRRKVEGMAPSLKVIDMSDRVAKIAMQGDHEEEHHDGPEDGHEHGHGRGLDPHVWLSPNNLRTMAATVADSLASFDPAHGDAYRRNLSAVERELVELDRRIAARLEPFQGASFFVFHPTFGYFAAAYGLVQEAVELQGKSPGPRQLAGLIARARKLNVRTIFVQPQFDQKAARAVAGAIGGQVVVLDSLAEDVPANLERMAEGVASALAP